MAGYFFTLLLPLTPSRPTPPVGFQQLHRHQLSAVDSAEGKALGSPAASGGEFAPDSGKAEPVGMTPTPEFAASDVPAAPSRCEPLLSSQFHDRFHHCHLQRQYPPRQPQLR